MRVLNRVVEGLRALLSRPRVERELDEELQAYLADSIAKKRATGLTEEEASLAAHIEFGSVEATKDRIRDVGWESMVLTTWQDTRYAVRLLRKSPTFAATAIVTLGLGIGGTTAVFSVVDALFLRAPDGVSAPSSLRRVFVKRNAGSGRSPDGSGGIWSDARDVRDGSRAFAGMAAYQLPHLVDLGRGESATRVRASVISHEFFTVLGVRPALGRLFLAEDDGAPGAHPFVVISHAMWQTRFGRAADVLGKSLLINSRPVEIVGVADQGFQGVDSDAVDVWIPSSMASPIGLGPEDWQSEDYLSGTTRHVARLWSSHDDPRAVAQASAALGRAAQAFPHLDPHPEVMLQPITLAGTPWLWAVDLSVWLMFAALFVLVIACANVANLLLARGVTRRRELAMRVALGASRWRVARQQLTESAVLGMLGGGVGVLFAYVAMGLMRQFPLPPTAGHLDERLLIFTLGVSLATVLAFGVLPALRTSRVAPGHVLKGAQSSGPVSRNRTRLVLVGLQVSLSVALLVGAALFVRSLREVAAIQGGADLNRLLTVEVNLPSDNGGTGSSRSSEFFQLALSRLSTMPGIEHAAVVHIPPFEGWDGVVGWRLPGRPPALTHLNVIGPNYFETAGTRLLRGRAIESTDTPSTEPVGVVNEAMARLLGEDAQALGLCVSILDGPKGPCIRVVGVVESQRARYLETKQIPMIFRAEAQAPNAILGFRRSPMLLVRTVGDAKAYSAEVHSALQSLGRDLPYVTVEPLSDRLRNQLDPFRLGATLFTFFGLLALLLAGVGLYGLLGYFVAERTIEVGIRRALGAPATSVVRLIVRQGLAPVGLGLTAGLLVALMAARVLASRLFGIGPRDPLSFAAAALFLTVVAVIATLIPAWRAVRVDPMAALRQD